MKGEISFNHKTGLLSYWRFLMLLLLLFLLTMVSCGGGGGEDQLADGGIGGTGYTVGPITALGSIFVNGIEYSTNEAKVTLNGAAGNEKDLQVGMVVRVEGIINADGKTGRANAVVFDHNAEGPVDSIDLGNNSLKIMGQNVLVEGQTVIADLSGGSLGLTSLAVNDLVEISGLADADGNIRATRIARKNAGSQSQVSGQVSALTSNTFKINTLTVDYGNAALIKFGTLGIQSGNCVIVKGHLLSSTVLLADSVEKMGPGFTVSDDIKIQGYIGALFYADKSISGFAMNTPFGLQDVALSASTGFMGGQSGDVKVGARVQVEGRVLNDVIQARQLRFF